MKLNTNARMSIRFIIFLIMVYSIITSCEKKDVPNPEEKPIIKYGNMICYVILCTEFAKGSHDNPAGTLIQLENTKFSAITTIDSSSCDATGLCLGKCEINGIPYGKYNILASRDGYSTTRWDSIEFDSINMFELYLSPISTTSVTDFMVTSNEDSIKYSAKIYPSASENQPRQILIFVDTVPEVSSTRHHEFYVGNITFSDTISGTLSLANQWSHSYPYYPYEYPKGTLLYLKAYGVVPYLWVFNTYIDYNKGCYIINSLNLAGASKVVSAAVK